MKLGNCFCLYFSLLFSHLNAQSLGYLTNPDDYLKLQNAYNNLNAGYKIEGQENSEAEGNPQNAAVFSSGQVPLQYFLQSQPSSNTNAMPEYKQALAANEVKNNENLFGNLYGLAVPTEETTPSTASTQELAEKPDDEITSNPSQFGYLTNPADYLKLLNANAYKNLISRYNIDENQSARAAINPQNEAYQSSPQFGYPTNPEEILKQQYAEAFKKLNSVYGVGGLQNWDSGTTLQRADVANQIAEYRRRLAAGQDGNDEISYANQYAIPEPPEETSTTPAPIPEPTEETDTDNIKETEDEVTDMLEKRGVVDSELKELLHEGLKMFQKMKDK